MTRKIRGFEVVAEGFRTLPDDVVKLPVRGSVTSAGIDFFATEDLKILPQQTLVFKTDVKAYMGVDEVLLIDVRSSMGFKNDLMLVNTLGVIDQDFYGNADSDGNIGIGLRNLKPEMTIKGYTKIVDINGQLWDIPLIEDLTEKNTVIIKAGERVTQGIFMKYLEADNCKTSKVRTGGIGSTDNKEMNK